MTGYQSKRAAAQDKPLTKEHGFINYAHQLMVKCFNEENDKHRRTTMNKDDDINPTSPAAQPAQEQNFCPRCGKRTADLTTIHTCTPPRENT